MHSDSLFEGAPAGLRAMELRHLRYFVAVAEAGSLSLAAQKLFIAQPPLSVQIRQLESAIGLPLFVRHTKGVRLTPAGQVLLPEVRELLQRVTQLRRLAQDRMPPSTGCVSIGFSPSTTRTVLPALLRGLGQHGPAPRIEVREMITAEQIEQLLDGRMDLGLARIPVLHPAVSVVCQISDPYCAALPAHHRLAGTRAIDLAELADDDFVAFTQHRAPTFFDQILQLCAGAGFDPRIVHEASTAVSILDLVGAGLGVAVVPASAATLQPAGVHVCALHQRSPAGLLTLVRPRNNDPAHTVHPHIERVERVLADVFSTLQQSVRRLAPLNAPAAVQAIPAT